MARVLVSKKILAEVAPYDGLSKNLKAFLEACESDRPPPRIYKRSGIAHDGREYLPYTDLNLHHHHLHSSGDPLLVTQHIDDCIYVIALAKHSDYIHGDKLQWLKDHAHLLDWTGCEHHLEAVKAHNQSDTEDGK
jgi:hypothetical protein